MNDEPNDDDPLPKLIAELDQAIATAPHLARVARGYFDAFTAEGFSDRQSLHLTATQLLSNPGTAP